MVGLQLPLACLSYAVFSTGAPAAQQITAIDYRPVVRSPAFPPGAGPVVLVDEAHNNIHTVSPTVVPHTDGTMPGRFTAFRDLLTADGLRVEPLLDPFSPESLSRADVLVIANALADENIDTWALPNPSAFDSEEIEDVNDWVRAGGSLLLIADHQHWAAAAAELAASWCGSYRQKPASTSALNTRSLLPG